MSFVGSGLCEELTFFVQRVPTVRACARARARVCVCDLEISTVRRPGRDNVSCATENKDWRDFEQDGDSESNVLVILA
jgi:hypothetical protein